MSDEKEVLIIRNTCINRLYDVVLVNYFTEDVVFLAKALEFADAISLKLEMEEVN